MSVVLNQNHSSDTPFLWGEILSTKFLQSSNNAFFNAPRSGEEIPGRKRRSRMRAEMNTWPVARFSGFVVCGNGSYLGGI